MTRVLHVVPSVAPDRGGPSRSVRQLADALRGGGIEVRVAAAGSEDRSVEVPLGHIPGPGEIPDRASRRRLLEAIRWADVIEIHSLWNGTSTAAATLARRAGTPYVLAPRGMLDPACLAKRRWLKTVYRLVIDRRTLAVAAGFHFLSEEERDRAIARPSAAVPRIVSPNGAPDLSSPLPPGRITERFPALAGRQVLLALGRLDPIKGLDLAIRALARLDPERRPALLLIGPDYGQAATLLTLAARVGVSKDVVLGGPVYGDDRYGLLAEADLVVLTSHYDCNPVVATEALAAGGAVLAVEGCGLSGYASRGAVAVVPRSVEAFAAETARLLGSPADIAALRTAGRAYALEHLSWARVIEPLIGLYETLTA